MRYSPIEQKISDLAKPVLEESELELILVRVQSACVQIFAQNPQTQNLGVDDCAKISRALSPLLDVEDMISGAYRLEISSPGFDRPLVTKQDFATYNGKEAKIECEIPNEDGQKRFRGILRGIDENQNVQIEFEDQTTAIPYDNILRAKLIYAPDKPNKPNKKEKK